ncbi:hypothetical protein SCUP234_03278 [Seiridium cupressi]
MPSETHIPEDYLERVYAGVLGKLIGVYVGRPFEGWTHQRILDELGPIHHYVHDKVDAPLLVTDDDVSGTFTFVRALEEHGANASISSLEIGKTWLNNVIEKRTIFWWGGRGVSTEHTAFLNLKNGIPAPKSGAIGTNGKTVAEQIGAQIFIDGWAMVAPANPTLAASFAEKAGSVSHDGESVYAAKLWAAMEAEAFVSKDVEHLLDTGLKFVPKESMIARLVQDVRSWAEEDGDWKTTRQRIEDKHGYHKFHGVCHVVPNHGIMIMALMYGQHSFHEAMHIINTCGWDTDCNSGNVGCLVAIMHGLAAFEGGPDWRGPLADRALISSADGGYTINNAARIAYDIANVGHQLAGEATLNQPKEGAQFHFGLPGSVQGFQAFVDHVENSDIVRVKQAVHPSLGPSLAIHFDELGGTKKEVEVLTSTFQSLDVKRMKTYEIGGSPLLYPGQRIKASVKADEANEGDVSVQLKLTVYRPDDTLIGIGQDAPATTLTAGESSVLEWTIPDDFGSQPIQAVGLALSSQKGLFHGTLWLDYLKWDGTPRLTLTPEAQMSNEFWHRSFVNAADVFHHRWSQYTVVQNRGEGTVTYGTRDWKDYSLTAEKFVVNIGGPSGLVIRSQGLNRYYALVFAKAGEMALVKALDEKRIVMATASLDWELDASYQVRLTANINKIEAQVGEVMISVEDGQYKGGGCGFVVTEGSIRVEGVRIE